MKSQTYSWKILLHKTREFFWPLLEGDDNTTPEDENIETYISGDNIEQAFSLQIKIYETEEDRRKSIESKAALFISTISVATSIVVAASTLITNNQQHNIAITFSVFISFVLSVYAVRTVWFSVKALEVGNYSVLGFNDINITGTKEQYNKCLIETLSKMDAKNHSIINKKVDYLMLAQEYYKRAIVALCIFSFIILSLYILKPEAVSPKPNPNNCDFLGQNEFKIKCFTYV